MAPRTFSLTLMVILFFAVCFLKVTTSRAFNSQNYYDALEKSILFFEGQRSGRLPQSQRLTWRGNSGMSDGASFHVTKSINIICSYVFLLLYIVTCNAI